MAGTKVTHSAGQIANFGNPKPALLPHQVAAAAQAGRAVVTESARKSAAAAGPAVSTSSRQTLASVLRREEPVRAAVKKVATSPVLSRVTKQAKVAPLHERVSEGIARRAPEKPVHDDVIKRAGVAKGPISAEHNRRLKRDDAIRRATPARTISITGGPAPADIANGLTTPNRGMITTHTLPFPVGTPQAVREATPEAAAVVLSTKPVPVMTLPPTVVVAEPKNNPDAMAPSGDGINRFAFMGGVVFVAWLMFKGAA